MTAFSNDSRDAPLRDLDATGDPPPSILHLVPGHVDIRPGQGSHKDVSARRAFFAATGLKYHCVNFDADVPLQFGSSLAGIRPTHILIEYSYYPEVAAALRASYPDAFIAVRSHNIEPLQEWTLSDKDTLLKNLRNVYAFARLVYGDVRVARIVDHVFVISPSEAGRYWRWLGIGGRVSWLPYIPPTELEPSKASGARDVIACLPGGAQSRRTIDLVNRFSEFAQAAKNAGWKCRFVVSGDIGKWPVKLTPAVEAIGYVADLPALYSRLAAVAVLSPIGYGFKTTVADAIWNGAAVLVHPAIGTDLPEELKPSCVILGRPTAAALLAAEAALRDISSKPARPEALIRRFNEEMDRFLRGRRTGSASGRTRAPK